MKDVMLLLYLSYYCDVWQISNDMPIFTYNIVKVIVIIVPNVIMISLHCLIHAIVMIKNLFGTTGIAIIWYVCAYTGNYISITLVINKFKYCSHNVLNLNDNEIVKVNRTNINTKCIVQQHYNNSDNMLHCSYCTCNGHLIIAKRNIF